MTATIIRFPIERSRRSSAAASEFETEAPQFYREAAQECVARAHLLTDRQRAFVISMAQWTRPLSDAQAEWLLALHQKVMEYDAPDFGGAA